MAKAMFNRGSGLGTVSFYTSNLTINELENGAEMASGYCFWLVFDVL